jgi:hypothetical protein
MFPRINRSEVHTRYQFDYEALAEIVKERIQLVRTELETEEMISHQTLEDSKIDKNFLVKYNLAE